MIVSYVVTFWTLIYVVINQSVHSIHYEPNHNPCRFLYYWTISSNALLIIADKRCDVWMFYFQLLQKSKHISDKIAILLICFIFHGISIGWLSQDMFTFKEIVSVLVRCVLQERVLRTLVCCINSVRDSPYLMAAEVWRIAPGCFDKFKQMSVNVNE